jgi:hypothetical protein
MGITTVVIQHPQTSSSTNTNTTHTALPDDSRFMHLGRYYQRPKVVLKEDCDAFSLSKANTGASGWSCVGVDGALFIKMQYTLAGPT